MAAWVAASILLSAVTYLFDFCSNIVVVVESKRKYPDAFWTMVAILIFSHTFNALIFKFKFPKEKNVVRAAYFLPLLHLWRLLDLLRSTLSLKGVQNLKSEGLNGMFCILGITIESMPLLYLQVAGLVKAGQNMSIVFKVSIAAAFLSAVYNGGSSVQTITPNTKHGVCVTLSAGLFIMFASITRCITFINFIVKEERRVNRAAFTLGILVSYWLFYWLILFPNRFYGRLRDAKKCLTCFVFGYMTLLCGPLYPMVSESRDIEDFWTMKFRCKLLSVALASFSIDLFIAIAFYKRGMSTYLRLTPLLLVPGYLLSLLWYMTVCTKRATSSITPVEQTRIEQQEEEAKVDLMIYSNEHVSVLVFHEAEAKQVSVSTADEDSRTRNVLAELEVPEVSVIVLNEDETRGTSCSIADEEQTRNKMAEHPDASAPVLIEDIVEGRQGAFSTDDEDSHARIEPEQQEITNL